MKDYLKIYFVYYPIFWIGYLFFIITKKTHLYAYVSLRKLYVLTKGKSNDFMSRILSILHPPYIMNKSNGILGNLTKERISTIASRINLDGYHIFDVHMDDSMINEIFAFALTEPARYLNLESKNIEFSKEKIHFNPEHPLSPRYDFTTDSIVKCPALQKLIFDQSLLAVAQQYLDAKPILDSTAFWWSVPYKGVGRSAAAQMYHFDMDRIKFLKFFFYITDVETDSGPHCYVKGSHRFLPRALARDGRFEDSEIEIEYGKNSMIEICGKRGSVIAADTRGFHKGKDLTRGKRLLFQIEFTNSMFGATYPSTKISYAHPSYKSIANRFEYTYRSIFT